MRGPFLCPDCQKLGYCRKYNIKKLKTTFDKNEQAFFLRVNKPAKKVYQDIPAVPIKLISLEKMRAQFRNQDTITTATPKQTPINTPVIKVFGLKREISKQKATKFEIDFIEYKGDYIPKLEVDNFYHVLGRNFLYNKEHFNNN